MVIQQYEKAKVIQDEQLERLTQICQEQGVRRGSLRLRLVLLVPAATGAEIREPVQPLEGHKGNLRPRGVKASLRSRVLGQA